MKISPQYLAGVIDLKRTPEQWICFGKVTPL